MGKEDTELCEQSGFSACMHQHQYSDFCSKNALASYAPDLTFEPTHIEVRFKFNLAEKTCLGSVIFSVVVNNPRNRTIEFNAIDFLNVTVEELDGKNILWSYDGEKIVVTWAEEQCAGDILKLKVDYLLKDPLVGMIFSYPDEEYPSRPVFVGTDSETEKARYWLPSVDFPTVRYCLDYYITSSKHHTILANGGLISEEEDGDSENKTAHWRLEFPCPSYLACVCVGEFSTAADSDVDDMPISYFGVKDVSEETLMRTFGRTPSMVKWLSNRVGRPFPWPKYYQIILPMFGGAMENISLVTYDDVFLLDEKTNDEYNLVTDSVNIHEMAHSYFGDAVVCRHFEHSWLKESWATYMQAIYYLENVSETEYQRELYSDRIRYQTECNSYVRPIVTRTYDHSWQLFDRHLYPGGAWRIHMLRCLLGDEVFWRGVTKYLEDNEKQVVETYHFRHALESVSHQNLNMFFDQWIYSCGYPKLKGTYEYNQQAGSVTLSFEQTQVSEKRKIGLFDIDLEVQLIEEAGTVHDAVISMRNGNSKGAYVFDKLSSKPLAVLVDPNLKLLHSLDFSPGESILEGTLRCDADLVNNIWAITGLIKMASKRSLQIVEDYLESVETYYYLRVEAVQGLCKASSSAAIDLLCKLFLNEKDHRAHSAMAASMGRVKDKRIRAALQKFLERDGPHNRGYAAALKALAQQSYVEDIPIFKQAVENKERSRWGVRGGIEALGAICDLRSESKEVGALELKEKEEEVFEYLRKLVEYGNLDVEVNRSSLVSSFVSYTSNLNDPKKQRITESILVDLLRDPLMRVRKAAVLGLVSLKARSKASTLSAMRGQFSQQDQHWLEKKISSLSSPTSNSTDQLKKEIQLLQTKIRKLEETQSKLLEKQGK